MTIKLIAIDIDGTLLNEKNELAAATITAVQAARDAGIKVVLCTGRPLTGVKDYLDQLGLIGADQYVVTFNGALAQTTSGDVLVHHTLTYTDYRELEALAEQFGAHFHTETNDYIYTANKDISPYTIAESFLVKMPIRYRSVAEMPEDLVVSKCMFIDDPAIISRAAANLPQAFTDKFYFVQSEPFFLEAMNKSASKGNAITGLAKDLHIDMADVMAIGDQGNDLSMITAAGLGVAMGNAIDDVKAAAQAITLPNSEDGVAAAINKYALS
ncbi:sugar-phosphatase [Furfurilactobacillus sp. WILCCON 0119]|uniref:sugar-phosphatase n=1 Tax=Furfurilactobacillus entadae TaxID=2922307 RepID=UPI0035EB6FA5